MPRIPPTRTVPELGASSPQIILIVVVFPAPLGPRNANSSPASNLQVEPVDRALDAEPLGDAAQLDHGAVLLPVRPRMAA